MNTFDIIYNILKDLSEQGPLTMKDISIRNRISQPILKEILRFLQDIGIFKQNTDYIMPKSSLLCKHCPFISKCKKNNNKHYILSEKGVRLLESYSIV
ncbi:MAG: hypothetical protein ACTSRZ_16935 [Promethearchaeota archaeon]